MDVRIPVESYSEDLKNLVTEVDFDLPPRDLFSLLYYNDDFMIGFLKDKEEVRDIEWGDWTEKDTRHTEFTKPLSGPVGPSEAHCINDETIEEEYSVVLSKTVTPNVPSGNDFSVLSRSVITDDGTGKAHLKVTMEVVWTKKNRWIGGMIEKKSLEGQKEHQEKMRDAIIEHISMKAARRKHKHMHMSSLALLVWIFFICVYMPSIQDVNKDGK